MSELWDDETGCRPFADDVELDRTPGLFRARTFNPMREGDPWSGTGNAAGCSDAGIWETSRRDSAGDTERDVS